MKNLFDVIIIILSFLISARAQRFEVKATGVQTFSFTDAKQQEPGSFSQHHSI